MILEPTAAANIVQLIAGSLSARQADEGRSFFSKQGGGNKIGMKVVDERVTILSDPFDPETPGAPFSGDGLPTPRRVWIENGVVKNLQYDRYWAQQQGVEPTGGGGGRRRWWRRRGRWRAPDARRHGHARGDDREHRSAASCVPASGTSAAWISARSCSRA